MPLMRRTLLAFVVTFCCALAVFTLPSITWNTLRAEPSPVATLPVQDSVQAPVPVQTAPVEAPYRASAQVVLPSVPATIPWIVAKAKTR